MSVKYICQSEKCKDSEANKFGRFEGDSDAGFCPRCGSDQIKRATKEIFNFGHSYICMECDSRSDFEDSPETPQCLYCECMDVVWIPPKYKSPSDVEKTLRRIADRYKLSDMGQRGGTRPGESVMRRPERSGAVMDGPPVNIGGFQTSIPADGSIRSAWTQSPVQGKLKGPVGVPSSAIMGKPSSPVPTNVVARYDGAA